MVPAWLLPWPPVLVSTQHSKARIGLGTRLHACAFRYPVCYVLFRVLWQEWKRPWQFPPPPLLAHLGPSWQVGRERERIVSFMGFCNRFQSCLVAACTPAHVPEYDSHVSFSDCECRSVSRWGRSLEQPLPVQAPGNRPLPSSRGRRRHDHRSNETETCRSFRPGLPFSGRHRKYGTVVHYIRTDFYDYC